MKPETEPVKDISIDGKTSVNEIIGKFGSSGGFTAKKLAVGVDIVESMVKDKDCLRFLSFPACIIATGARGVVKDMLKRKMFDIVITTCGTLDHDIARVYEDYYHGDFMMDDRELRDRGVNRLGNVLVPNESYGIILEDKFKEFLPKIFAGFSEEQKRKGISTHELVWRIGELMEKDPQAKRKEDSIVYWCWKNKVPMVVPGPTDGSVGYQIWQFAQDHDLKLDILADETLLSDKVWNAKRSGALIVGGGISKHHVIWHAQFANGLDYVVYVTTAEEFDGSLSGAQPREAISWGKMKKDANNVLINGDATIILPIVYAALVERLK